MEEPSHGRVDERTQGPLLHGAARRRCCRATKRGLLAAQRALMYIDGKVPEGYVVICTPSGRGPEHSFLCRRLGPSVECPMCGQTALSVDLFADFYRRSLECELVAAKP